MEDDARDVLGVSAQCIDRPSASLVESPDSNIMVVASRDDQRQRRVERGPVDTLGMSLEHVAHLDVHTKELTARKGVIRGDRHGHRTADRHRLACESGEVPDTDGAVEGGGDDEVLSGVEAGAHDVVVVSGEDGDRGTGLPVPDADGLVIGCREDPWVVMVELYGADVIEVAG